MSKHNIFSWFCDNFETIFWYCFCAVGVDMWPLCDLCSHKHDFCWNFGVLLPFWMDPTQRWRCKLLFIGNQVHTWAVVTVKAFFKIVVFCFPFCSGNKLFRPGGCSLKQCDIQSLRLSKVLFVVWNFHSSVQQARNCFSFTVYAGHTFEMPSTGCFFVEQSAPKAHLGLEPKALLSCVLSVGKCMISGCEMVTEVAWSSGCSCTTGMLVCCSCIMISHIFASQTKTNLLHWQW